MISIMAASDCDVICTTSINRTDRNPFYYILFEVVHTEHLSAIIRSLSQSTGARQNDSFMVLYSEQTLWGIPLLCPKLEICSHDWRSPARNINPIDPNPAISARVVFPQSGHIRPEKRPFFQNCPHFSKIEPYKK